MMTLHMTTFHTTVRYLTKDALPPETEEFRKHFIQKTGGDQGEVADEGWGFWRVPSADDDGLEDWVKRGYIFPLNSHDPLSKNLDTCLKNGWIEKTSETDRMGNTVYIVTKAGKKELTRLKKELNCQ